MCLTGGFFLCSFCHSSCSSTSQITGIEGHRSAHGHSHDTTIWSACPGQCWIGLKEASFCSSCSIPFYIDTPFLDSSFSPATFITQFPTGAGC